MRTIFWTRLRGRGANFQEEIATFDGDSTDNAASLGEAMHRITFKCAFPEMTEVFPWPTCKRRVARKRMKHGVSL
jgi:hypothetical protein